MPALIGMRCMFCGTGYDYDGSGSCITCWFRDKYGFPNDTGELPEATDDYCYEETESGLIVAHSNGEGSP